VNVYFNAIYTNVSVEPKRVYWEALKVPMTKICSSYK